MKFTTLILILLNSIALCAVELPTVIVTPSKSHNEAEEHIKAQEVTAQTKNWGRSTEAQKNEYGVELTQMEKIGDLSNERKLDQVKTDGHKGAVKLLVGKKQIISTKISANKKFEIEGYLQNDHSKYEYIDNKGTPYTSTDDSVSSYKIKKRLWGIRTKGVYQLWDGDLAYDHLKKDEVAIVKKVGTIDNSRTELNLNHTIFDFGEATLHLRRESNQFLSSDINLLDQDSTTQHVNLHSAFIIRDIKIEVDGKDESFKRKFRSIDTLNFKRNAIYSKISKEISIAKTRSELYVKGEVDRDQSQNSSKTNLSYQVGAKSSLDLYKKTIFVDGNLRQYQLIPDATMYFGNGSFIDNNNDLPLERGFRYHLGPRLSFQAFSTHLYFTSENNKNRPMAIGSSPSHARYYPIGAIWSRGFEWEGSYTNTERELTLSINRQEVLNDSAIAWQKGKQIPGIPLLTITFKILQKWNRVETMVGCTHTQKEFRDLSNDDRVPNQTLYSGKLLYHISKTWNTWLEADAIFFGDKLKQNYSFEGSAGKYITTNTIPQNRLFFGLEVKI